VYLHIPDEVYDFINAHEKAIKVGGPLFFGLRAEWKRTVSSTVPSAL
jgi:hypothetical protein